MELLAYQSGLYTCVARFGFKTPDISAANY